MSVAVPKFHELFGKYVTLRTPAPADYPQLQDMLNDKVTMTSLIHFFGRDTWSDEQVRERYETFQSKQDQGLGMTYSVTDLRLNRIVGNCGFKNIDLNKGSAEFGLILHRTVWGTGVAKECHLLCLEFAFTKLGLDLVWFYTDFTNKRMQKFFEKAHIPQAGLYEGYPYFELPSSQWPITRNQLVAGLA